MELSTFINAEYIFDFINQYRKMLLIIASAIILASGVGLYLYIAHTHYEAAAQQALSELLVEYNNAYGSLELWNDVEIGAKIAGRQYGRSAVAPYFLCIQADALCWQGKYEEGLAAMMKGFGMLHKKSLLYDAYALKFAHLQLASADETNKAEGLQSLIALARDPNNMQLDKALYDLAEYYEAHNDNEKAHDIRMQLIGLRSSYKDMMSPWIMLAEQREAVES